jgi:localization factor PodJL
MTATYVLTHVDVIASWSRGAPQAKANGPGQPTAASAPPTKALAEAPGTLLAADPAISAAASDRAALFNQATDRIKAKDFSGLDLLRKAADLGYAPAQFYLARLYEQGGAGLKTDAVEARRWTEQAAAGGDPEAMHNLGLYYFHGEGGPKDVAAAALWFRRAADLGLVDSQYNLAQLYEQGLGVSRSPAEAYKWFVIAARAGDGESKLSADRLKSGLSASDRQAGERAAAAFHADSAGPSFAAAPAAQASKTQ